MEIIANNYDEIAFESCSCYFDDDDDDDCDASYICPPYCEDEWCVID